MVFPGRAALSVGTVFAMVASLAATPRCAFGQEAAAPSVAFERTRELVLDDFLLADEELVFDRRPVLDDPLERSQASVRSYGVFVSYVIVHSEFGASQDYAGTGSGLSAKGSLSVSDAWDATFGLTFITEGLHSDVDLTESELACVSMGVGYRAAGSSALALWVDAGVSWIDLDVKVSDPGADISGLGLYAGLAVEIELDRRLALRLESYLSSWSGSDGVGRRGDELSLTAGAGLAVRF